MHGARTRYARAFDVEQATHVEGTRRCEQEKMSHPSAPLVSKVVHAIELKRAKRARFGVLKPGAISLTPFAIREHTSIETRGGVTNDRDARRHPLAPARTRNARTGAHAASIPCSWLVP